MPSPLDNLDGLLTPYNPWWTPASRWTAALPKYRRHVVRHILSDLADLPQAVSVSGPRRVGKSTALKHVIEHLIATDGIDPRRILYFSFDDPAVFSSADAQERIFDVLVEKFRDAGQRTYFFLDEIQRLPRWELFVKKHYDLGTPVRFIVSGSASSPIFRSSHETLLGRIKDRHLLPFTFREYCEYRLRERPAFAEGIAASGGLRAALADGDAALALRVARRLADVTTAFAGEIEAALNDFCCEGGFPEVWPLRDPARKVEYLMEQQVRKVLFEDLFRLTAYRKPENVLRFFVFMLAHPGIEVNLSKVSSEVGVERHILAENLPRLEMTDLLMRVPKFCSPPLRARQRNFKCYPTDPALRNAVLKAWAAPDPPAMGLVAEGLVARTLSEWPERVELSYFRDRDVEVDFVLSSGNGRPLPFEVKYRDRPVLPAGLRAFVDANPSPLGVVLTRAEPPRYDGFLFLPLPLFLLGAT